MIENTGLIEVPMGQTLEDIVFTIGIRDGKLKVCRLVDWGRVLDGIIGTFLWTLTPSKSGAMMGSGGLVVMDENTCMWLLAFS